MLLKSRKKGTREEVYTSTAYSLSVPCVLDDPLALVPATPAFSCLLPYVHFCQLVTEITTRWPTSHLEPSELTAEISPAPSAQGTRSGAWSPGYTGSCASTALEINETNCGTLPSEIVEHRRVCGLRKRGKIGTW
jgi:hypothetical protein